MKTLLAILLLIPSLSWGMDKNELKEELKYWKSLLDDELISQEDYNRKKEELINLSIPSNQVSDTKQITQSSTNEQKNYYFNGYELNSNQIKTIQTKLKSLGWDISVDGVLGNQTKKSIREWLECNNFKTSSFNDVSFNSLRETKKPCRAKFTTAQSEEKTEDKKSLPDGYDIIVTQSKSQLCKRHIWTQECPEKDKLGFLLKGEYLKIINVDWNYSTNQPSSFLVKSKRLGIGSILANHVEVLDKDLHKIYYGEAEKDKVNLSNLNTNYDAIVKIQTAQLCKSPHYGKCANKDTLSTLNKGDYLMIKDKFVGTSGNVYVKTEKNYSGFVNVDNIEIFEPNKFSHSNSVSNKNKSTAIASNTNTSNTSKTSSSSGRCSGLNDEKSWVYKGLTGYFSKKDACLKIASYSDDELCSKIERGKDKTLNPYENKYKKEISSRGVACIDGIAFNKSDTSTKTLQVIKKLEDKIDNQPKYKEVCRYENVLGERLDGSTYPKKIKSCKNVRIKSQKELNSEALGGAIMSIFD